MDTVGLEVMEQVLDDLKAWAAISRRDQAIGVLVGGDASVFGPESEGVYAFGHCY